MQGCVNDESLETLAADAKNYWSQSGVRPWVADMSHWRGRGRWADDQVWTSIGHEHVQMFRQLCLLSARTAPVRTMLEWGPGGGANLQECGRQLTDARFRSFHPVEIDAAQPERVLAAVDEPIDFALSTAVFQHFPGKEYGQRVLNILHRLLAPDGIALIQTRFDDGSETLACKHSDYARNVVTFTSYRIEEFWDNCAQAGFQPLSVVLKPEPCYAYYFLRKGTGRE
jgi:methyltransferase family protein